VDPGTLNWLKDVGIATVTLLVLGRLMSVLLQSTMAFYEGVREDNKERNEQFETPLSINQASAGQMALTRQAIEQIGPISEQQAATVRTSVAALQGSLTTAFGVLSTQMTDTRQDILDSLAQLSRAGQHSAESEGAQTAPPGGSQE
jgi:hypothetical protein